MNKLMLSLMTAAALSSVAPINARPVHGPNQGSGPGYERLQLLEAQAKHALKSGNIPATAKLAAQLLRENTDKSSWNYGNVVYDANQLLGIAALRQGNVAAADRYLLAAGRTPGSPQLDSFGPNMTLAQALYSRGQKQAVSQFLSLVIKFWGTTRPGMEAFASLDKQHADLIHAWQAQIRAGQKPSLDRSGSTPSSQAAQAEPPTPALLAEGTAAPDFDARDRDGRLVHLSDFKGKVVVLDFWSTWCGPCQRSLPHTNEVARQFAGKSVVLAVNVWDTADAFQKWLPLHPEYDAVRFAIDPSVGSKAIPDHYHVSGIPTQYVIDGQGVIVKSFVGYDGPTDDLSRAIIQAAAHSAH